MISRRAFSVALASFALIGPALAHPHGVLDQERVADIERQIMTFRNALKDAATAKDVARLRGMFTASFTHTHTTGAVDGRDARVTQIASGDPVIELAPVSELSIRIHGTDMAIVSGRSPIMNRTEGRTVEVRWTQVMTRASGEWQLASSQATRIPSTS
jgi:hypothetical protein